MTSSTITDADRRAARVHNAERGGGCCVSALSQAFAAHREQARRDALEEAARVAEAQCKDWIGEDCCLDQAGDIAAAIRAL